MGGVTGMGRRGRRNVVGKEEGGVHLAVLQVAAVEVVLLLVAAVDQVQQVTAVHHHHLIPVIAGEEGEDLVVTGDDAVGGVTAQALVEEVAVVAASRLVRDQIAVMIKRHVPKKGEEIRVAKAGVIPHLAS